MGHADSRKTKDIIEKQRRKEMLENNMKVFGNVSIGIHGKELPKYHKSMAEWWTNKGGYKPNPSENSLLRFKQSKKYWAKKDNILLCDVVPDEPEIDDFKKKHATLQRKNQVATAPNKIKRVNKYGNFGFNEKIEKPQKNYSWTSIENQFVKRNTTYADEIKRARAERTDFEPLYSSFNPEGTFVPPPTTVDALNKQKEKLNKTSISHSITTKSRGLRMNTAVPIEESLMATGNGSGNLFARVGSVEGSPVQANDKSFKNLMYQGIRVGAFKNQ